MTTSKSWTMVVAGYSILAVAMLAFLTINGVSSTAVGTIGTAGLIGLGLLLPATGMLELARHMDPPQGAPRKGLVLQSLSLIGLLIGLVVSFVASSLSGHLVSALFIMLSGTSGLVGAILISKETGTRLIVVGAALIATGAALIPASNIALIGLYWISDMEKYVNQDIGATLAACGSVVAANSWFVVHRSDKTLAVSRS